MSETFDSYHDEAARIRRAREQDKQLRRWIAFGYGLVVFVVLGAILGGCSGITAAHEEAAQVEAAALAGDLDAWSDMTDEEQRASLAQAHAFAVEMCKALGVELPEEIASDRR